MGLALATNKGNTLPTHIIGIDPSLRETAMAIYSCFEDKVIFADIVKTTPKMTDFESACKIKDFVIESLFGCIDNEASIILAIEGTEKMIVRLPNGDPNYTSTWQNHLSFVMNWFTIQEWIISCGYELYDLRTFSPKTIKKIVTGSGDSSKDFVSNVVYPYFGVNAEYSSKSFKKKSKVYTNKALSIGDALGVIYTYLKEKK